MSAVASEDGGEFRDDEDFTAVALMGVSVRTGAGKSGEGSPATGTSIHRTISPDEYVCSALNVSRTALSGTEPAATGKFSY